MEFIFRKWVGKKRSADDKGAAAYVDAFAKRIAEEDLCLEQVYNADETALDWRCRPWNALTTEDEELSGSKLMVDLLS